MEDIANLPAKIAGQRVSVDEFRAILAYPTWNFVQQAVASTRSYYEGLQAGMALAGFVEEHRDELSHLAFENAFRRLSLFILQMLDKSDQWEAYLETWESLRSSTEVALTYSPGALAYHGERIRPFVLGRSDGALLVHYLWPSLHRKELIERKLRRQQAGQRIGNMLHAKKSELSDAEISDRLAWVARWAASCGRAR